MSLIMDMTVVVVSAGVSWVESCFRLAEASSRLPVFPSCSPTRSHTAAAQGGINVALGNMHKGDWHWHMC